MRHALDHHDWTDEQVDYLRELYAQGLSASTIAAAIGGITRNAVIGKVHRLGLEPRIERKAATRIVKPVVRPSAPAPLRAPRPVPTLPRDAPPAARRLPLVELGPHDCRWPLGDPAQPGFAFCAAPQREGSSYCAFHARMAYNRLPNRPAGPIVPNRPPA